MTKSVFDVVVVGNVGIDTNVYFHSGEMNLTVEANFTENVDHIGQAGGYASRGFAQLGHSTCFIGYVGNDYSGRFIKEEFTRDGIDTTGLFIDHAGTSRSINFMYQDGRRKNFYDGKSHMMLTPDIEMCRCLMAKSKLVHFSIPNWARLLLPVAKKLGLTISCDIQDVVSADDPYRREFIEAADILFFSAVNHDGPEYLLHKFREIRPDQIVVSGMGARGCALFHNNQIQFFSPIELETAVVDTNGAGDGLAVGFLRAFVLEKRSLADSIKCGQIVARHTCSQKASTDNLIKLAQLEQYMLASC